MNDTTHIEPGLHENLEQSLGSGDLRLLYGLGFPFLTAAGLIIGAIVSGSIIMGALALVAVLVLTAGIVREFGHLLEEDDDA